MVLDVEQIKKKGTGLVAFTPVPCFSNFSVQRVTGRTCENSDCGTGNTVTSTVLTAYGARGY